jgi:aspartyl-tRNA(Asn)/glutamyl-tRNA(Gln) amidotransferase subunit C
MRVTPDDVRHIAALARLRFSADEQDRLAGELSRILDYVDQLGELDTSEVPPLAHVLSASVGAPSAVRPDRAEQRISHDEALANAPDTDGTYFRVPKVIE